MRNMGLEERADELLFHERRHVYKENDMSVAQTRAARRKFREYYGKPIIGRPHYRRKSASRMDRDEQRRRETARAIASRGKK